MSAVVTQPREPFDTGWALERLFEVALPHLPQEELQLIASSASEHAQEVSRHCATVLEGLGCLVSNDERCGALQGGRDVSALLFHAANVMHEVSALQYIASEAEFALSPRGSRAEKKSATR